MCNIKKVVVVGIGREYWCKLWVYWGTFKDEREQTKFTQKLVGGIERVFFFENNTTGIAVESKTTLINTSLPLSARNKS